MLQSAHIALFWSSRAENKSNISLQRIRRYTHRGMKKKEFWGFVQRMETRNFEKQYQLNTALSLVDMKLINAKFVSCSDRSMQGSSCSKSPCLLLPTYCWPTLLQITSLKSQIPNKLQCRSLSVWVPVHDTESDLCNSYIPPWGMRDHFTHWCLA